MSWAIGPFGIALPTGDALEEAKRFCNSAYFDHGYISEDSALFPRTFYAVHEGGKLRGTIGVHRQDTPDELFPTEAAMNFRLQDLGIDPATTGEVTRFSGNGRTFVAVIAWMANHMHEELGFKTALFGIKPYIKDALDGMKIWNTVHEGLTVPDFNNVPAEFRPYFADEPIPIVVTVDLAAVNKNVLDRLAELSARAAP